MKTEYSILVLDTDLQSLQFIEDSLKPKFTVYAESNPQQALDFLAKEERDQTISVIISNNRSMNDLSGAKFLKKSFLFSPNSFRILLIDQNHLGLDLDYNEHKIDEHIMKPFNEDILVRRVANAYENFELKIKNKYFSFFAHENILRSEFEGTENVGLQEKVIDEYYQAHTKLNEGNKPSMQYIAEDLGIKKSRIHRIINGHEMKLPEYEKFINSVIQAQKATGQTKEMKTETLQENISGDNNFNTIYGILHRVESRLKTIEENEAKVDEKFNQLLEKLK